MAELSEIAGSKVAIVCQATDYRRLLDLLLRFHLLPARCLCGPSV